MDDTSTDHEAPVRRSGGRSLDPARDQAIRDAALACLTEIGYEGLTMDLVATRAKAGKGALYRRWPSKEALVIDAIVCAKPEVEIAVTDSLLGDLDAYVAAWPAEHDHDHDLALAVMQAAQRDPEFAGVLRTTFIEPRQQVLRGIVERARARGEAPPDVDVEAVIELVPAVAIARATWGPRPMDRDDLRHLVEHVLLPLLTRR